MIKQISQGLKTKPKSLGALGGQMKGALLILLSSVIFGTYGIWSKLMADSFGAFFQAWTRGLIVLLILVPFGIVTKKFMKIAPGDWKWFLAVSLPGALVFSLYFLGFEGLPVGTATLLFYSALTLATYILGIVFFHEKMDAVKIISLVMGVVGLGLVFGFEIRGAILAGIATVAAGFCGGTEIVFTKKLSGKYSPVQITTSLFATDVVLNFGLFLVLERFGGGSVPPLGKVWGPHVAFSFATLSAFTLATLGYKWCEPSVGGIIGLMEIVFGVVFGIIFFGEAISTGVVVGGILIMVAASLRSVLKIAGALRKNTAK